MIKIFSFILFGVVGGVTRPINFYLVTTVMNSHLAHWEKSVLLIYSAFLASIAFASCSVISSPFT